MGEPFPEIPSFLYTLDGGMMDERLGGPPCRATHGEQDSNGVDISLLRYLLGLTPLERLVLMEGHARDTEVLHEHGHQHREAAARRDR